MTDLYAQVRTKDAGAQIVAAARPESRPSPENEAAEARLQRELPQLPPEIKHLAALIYGEATAEVPDETEMLAIGWTVRNRLMHTKIVPSDRKWFGHGDYKDIIEHKGPDNTHQYVAVDEARKENPKEKRYRNFLDRRFFDDSKEIEFALLCVGIAKKIVSSPGPDKTYDYIWFKALQRSGKVPSNPSPKRAEDPPSLIHRHYFWRFAPGKDGVVKK